MQYVAFSDWLLSLSNMHLGFLHVFSRLDSSIRSSAVWVRNQGYSGLTIDGNIPHRVMGGEYIVFRDTGQYQILKTKMKMVP